jgi:leucine-zipper of insertion element IS481
MDLHANAALSLNKRRRLARRVVEEGWTLTEATAAAEVSLRCARKWVGRYRSEGELGLLDRSSAPAVVANWTAEDRVEAIAALRRLRFPGRRSPRCSRWRCRPSRASSPGSGWASSVGSGSSPPAATSARPGELVHVDVKKLGRIQGGAGKRVRGAARSPYNTQLTDRAGRRRNTVGWEF